MCSFLLITWGLQDQTHQIQDGVLLYTMYLNGDYLQISSSTIEQPMTSHAEHKNFPIT